MNKLNIVKFLEQVKSEAKKVSWPTKKELTMSIVIVVISVLVFSLATMLVDYLVHGLVSFFLNIGK